MHKNKKPSEILALLYNKDTGHLSPDNDDPLYTIKKQRFDDWVEAHALRVAIARIIWLESKLVDEDDIWRALGGTKSDPLFSDHLDDGYTD